MANDPISAVSGSASANSAASAASAANAGFNQDTFTDNNQISALLMSGSLDPKFAGILMNQMSANNVDTILFGNEDTSGSSSTGNVDIFNNLPTGQQTTFNPVDQNSVSSGVSPQFEISVYSSLIGKTVTAKKPLSGGQLTGKVISVQVQNGAPVLNVDGTLVPPANLIKIQ